MMYDLRCNAVGALPMMYDLRCNAGRALPIKVRNE